MRRARSTGKGRPCASSLMDESRVGGKLEGGAHGQNFLEQRAQAVQGEHVAAVGRRATRLWMRFQEEAVAARRGCGPHQRRDELGIASTGAGGFPGSLN